ncbi:TraM recognition domain-containing protein [Yinghuangia sp. ASG 101]|uniref:type IV secretory system conjugative DNA transfer family protein n=1 Tax=Yinghuangia sp. ASG 101 TaxID=2896848 RepID=UPI001E4B3CE8|nr:type IV secretory system conjugative DNA transfer family protein [Yinghuangia sp. ASG 101]UGQ09022.1 TraM recognition domain-containing protein [Yinghuangia sp. ASG 101]
MSAVNRHRGPDIHVEALVIFSILIGLFTIGGLITAAAAIGAARTGAEAPPKFPPVTLLHLALGKYAWPGRPATLALTAMICGLVLLALLVMYARKGRPERIDRACRYLAAPVELQPMTTHGVLATARKLMVPESAPPGIYIGRTVREKADLWGSWEDMHVDIWGPRTGKTATRAIPNIVAAPGCVVVTSNKRDVVDHTRGVREQAGHVWIFDPQNQAGGKPVFWWDPLSYVGTSIVKAVKLAARFSTINRQSHQRSDAYFEPAAQDLFANLLLAASITGKPITQVYEWLTRPTDDTPVRILRDGGHRLPAKSVASVITAPDRQRAGVYGTAIQLASFLVADNINEWVTPGSDPTRPRFDVIGFLKSSDTLYLLSEETNKVAAPLVLALTTILAEEAENIARDSPGGRLPVPALFVLDEAANVCPWKALPDKYTHFGSRGVIVMLILQSWAQGVAVWGDTGMAKLWGSANVRVYGGGVSDVKFLDDLSKSSGVFEPRTGTMSVKWGDHRSFGVGSRSESVLDSSDLMAMPRGRAFVQLSGARPTLVRTVPWWEGPYASVIRASLARYEPRPTITLVKEPA